MTGREWDRYDPLDYEYVPPSLGDEERCDLEAFKDRRDREEQDKLDRGELE